MDKINFLFDRLIEEDNRTKREELTKTIIKRVEREIKTVNFKYEQTVIKKNALQNILDSTIEELMEKNKSLEKSNEQLTVAKEELKQNTEELRVLNTTLEERVEQATADIKNKRRIIEKKNSDLLKSINYAQRIQNAILTPEEGLKTLLPNYCIFFQPRDVVSGDFYWFHNVAHYIFIAVVDCTGHGVPGAFMSLIINNGINAAVKLLKIYEPSEILDYLNTHVTDVLKQSGTSNQDGADMSICRINTNTKQVIFSGAKHNLLLFKNGEYTMIKGTNKPIGGNFKRQTNICFDSYIIDYPNEFYGQDKQKYALNFYMFTDGFPDQIGGKKNRKLMRKNFIGFIHSIEHLPSAQQKEKLAFFLKDWKGNAPQIDDILVLNFKI